MRDNRDRWQFYNHPSKPVLTAQEVRYWKSQLEKVLKVGVEFEFNLPDQKGTCKGDNPQCACNHIEEECWKECANLESCAKVKCMDTCASKTAKCTPDKCKKCEDYKFQCIGITCVDFLSKCFDCDKFERNCGTCPKKYNPHKDPAAIRESLNSNFRPTKHYGKVNESGVVMITTDGSLLGDRGVEIVTIGRRVDYWEFYKMSRRIIDKVVSSGGYLNERTSSHMHVLTSYYENENSNELEKDIPQIVLANFHQLVRRYQNALTWMTIALDDPNHMTRWEKFRVSVLGMSPVMKSMRMVAQDVHKHSNNNKYGFINYDRVKFNNEDVSRFHVEFREADSTLSPSYYAAIACLHYAFVIKALDISRYGLLKVGDESWLNKAKEMKEVILNGNGDWGGSRVSDTRYLLENREYFISESIDLVIQMKSILLKLGPAYEVLMKLAENPVAMRRIEGQSWKTIEDNLSVRISKEDEIDIRIQEMVDLQIINDCKSKEEWISEIHKVLKEEDHADITEDKIEKYVDGKMREGELIWSESAGCMLAI